MFILVKSINVEIWKFEWDLVVISGSSSSILVAVDGKMESVLVCAVIWLHLTAGLLLGCFITRMLLHNLFMYYIGHFAHRSLDCLIFRLNESLFKWTWLLKFRENDLKVPSFDAVHVECDLQLSAMHNCLVASNVTSLLCCCHAFENLECGPSLFTSLSCGL